jgi:choline dehydrogenase-like flavoprotein
MVPVFIRPTSRGTLTLKSGDPYESPIIDPNSLSTKNEWLTMRAAIRLGRQVCMLQPITSYVILDNKNLSTVSSRLSSAINELLKSIKLLILFLTSKSACCDS